MKKEEELLNDLTELIKETQKNKVDWKVDCQTTEYNDLQENRFMKKTGNVGSQMNVLFLMNAHIKEKTFC